MERFTDRFKERHQSDSEQEVETRPARPKDYIAPFRQLLSRALRDGMLELLIVLYVRVSGPKQRRDGNLVHQLANLRERIMQLADHYGIKVTIVAEFHEDVSGWKLWKSGRPELVKAAKVAKKTGAKIVALHTSRLVRNNRHTKGTAPTIDDFEKLTGLVGYVPLATIRYPDYQEDRGGDTSRGKRYKDRSPGYKKRRRGKVRRELLNLMDSGLGNRAIARKLNLPEPTVRRWRKRYGR